MAIMGKKDIKNKKGAAGGVDESGYLDNLENYFSNNSIVKPSQADIEARNKRLKNNSQNQADLQQQKPIQEPAPTLNQDTEEEVEFSPGDIVCWGSNQDSGVFRRYVREKNYDLVYKFIPDGTIAPKGVVLNAHGVKIIGSLPSEVLWEIEQSKVWERDQIIFHLNSHLAGAHIPQTHTTQPTQPPVQQNVTQKTETVQAPQKPQTVAKPAPTPLAEGMPILERGMQFSIKFGANSWDAVFWGKDIQGTVIANKTNDKWALMHLDLTRFKNSLVLKGMLTSDQQKELENSIIRSSQTSF